MPTREIRFTARDLQTANEGANRLLDGMNPVFLSCSVAETAIATGQVTMRAVKDRVNFSATLCCSGKPPMSLRGKSTVSGQWAMLDHDATINFLKRFDIAPDDIYNHYGDIRGARGIKLKPVKLTRLIRDLWSCLVS